MTQNTDYQPNKPVIFLAFAQDRVEGGVYLRNLPIELDGIRKALQKARQADLCEVVERSNTTVENILDVFQEYQDRIAIFHYGGHAGSYELLLESLTGEHAMAHSEGLVSFLAKQKGLQLVFLNGCCSQQQALDLIEAGLPAVIGTSQKIDDEIATNLSGRFYKGLAAGLSIDRAWAEAVDQIKVEKGTSNTRALHWKGKVEASDRFPWEIYYRKGAEIVKDWNLPEAVANPLFGLPEIPKTYDLPETPFLFLKRYERPHAEIFFGRSYYIRDLYNRISGRNAPPIILLYGQSGVGKSSLFDAGLNPRLENDYEVIYIRRMPEKGLAGSLEFALEQKLEKMTGTPPTAEATAPAEKEDALAGKQTLLQLETAAKDAPEKVREEIEALIQRLRGSQQSVTSDQFSVFSNVGETFGLLAKWKQIEVRARKPLIVILDQVEELFTRPNKLLPNELEDFLAALAAMFGTPEQRPVGKLILGYRKEYHPEIEEGFKAHRLPRATLFLEQLKRKDILDIFRGLTQTHALKVRYGLSVEEELPVTVADDLLEDRDSPVAPVLQILLTKMWNAATQENPTAPRFTVAQYLKLKTEGIAMGEFFEQQMRQLRTWQSDVVDSGLALDVLYFHTTAMGTAGSHSLEEIRRNYQHRQDIIDELIAKCKELYLLTEAAEGHQKMSLTHDTLAPVVASQYNSSDKPGQRAARILSNKVSDFREAQDGIWLDQADLKIVEQGQQGMRELVVDEEKLLEISRERRRRYRRIRNVLVAAVIVSAGVAAWQWREAVTQREVARREAAEAQSNLLAKQADEMFKSDRTQALRLAETAYHFAPTTSAEKTLLHIYYQTLAGRQRFYTSRLSHGNEVTAVAFSPVDSLMLTASRDHTAKLWSAAGDLLATLRHDDAVNAATFSPDGQRIVTVSDDATAKLWSSRGDSLMIFQHNASVKSVCFPADGSRILTAADNGSAHLWLTSGDLIATFKHGLLALNDAAISPDGNRILTASEDGTAKLWAVNAEATNGESLVTFRHNGPVNSVTFSADGAMILTASADGTARLWTAAGKLQTTVRHEGPVLAAIFVADGSKVLTTSEDATAKLWSTAGELLATFQHHGPVYTAVLSADGSRIVTASRDSTARLWSGDGELIAAFRHDGGVEAVALSRDGKQILTGSRDRTARLWPASRDSIPTFLHEAGVKTVVVSPDGGRILTASDDGTARLWSWRGEVLAKFEHEAGIATAIFSPDSKRVLTASRDKTAKLWSLDGSLASTFKHDSTVYHVEFSADGQKILTASLDGTAKLWSLDHNLLVTFQHAGAVYYACFSADDRRILTASDDSTARLWSTSGDLIHTFRHDGEVWSAVFSPDGRKILTASSDYTARLWSINGDSLATFEHDDRVWRAIFSPDGKQVLTASFDGAARLWSLTGEALARFPHDGIVWSACFSNDGRHILTASDDASARLWSASDDTLMTLSHEAGVQSAIFSPDGRNILTSSDDYTVRLWKTPRGINEWLKEAAVYRPTSEEHSMVK